MKIFLNHTATFFLTITLVLLQLSCKKFIEIPPPPNQVVSSSVFTDDNSAVSAIVGLYSEMTKTNLNYVNGALTLYPGLSADELYLTAANSTVDVFTLNEIPSNSNIIKTNFWTAAYSYIYHANAVLEGLNHSPVSDAVKAQLTGEAKVIRAFCYFYLVNLFGDVPLILSTDYRVNAAMPRTAANLVYKQIVRDLADAKNTLRENYPSAGRLRPNKWTAVALLARVYLYQQAWQKAETEATELVNSGVYSLASITTPLSSSNEVIWQLGRQNANTAEGAVFIPSSATVRPTYALTDSLVNAFEPGDQRKVNWIKSNTVSGKTYYYPYKYKVASSTSITESLIVFRYAEILLVRAEARIAQNNVAGAISDLNMIRNRAGLTLIPVSATAGEVAKAIQKERRTEFFAEWGHRWLDLKRRDEANQVLSGMKASGWQSTDVLYPIPLSELESNIFLTQNPGY
jgi:hypothetical protein